MQKNWVLSATHAEQVRSVAQDHHLSSLIAQILLNRDLTTRDEISQFLQPSLAHLPDPSGMKDMARAVARLQDAVAGKERITIFGDYDVDGTTATALLMDFFQSVGAVVDFYIPHRMHEGYSLNVNALDKIRAQGTKVLITVDNGISAHREAAHAKQIGLDLIITDHHEVPEKLPEAYAVLNPKQKGDTFPGKELAGVGVAFYLLIALRKALRDAGMLPDQEPNLRLSLDLVAVGTIADMAPLRGINRNLVKEGLKVLSRTQREGLRALMEVSAVDGEVRADQVAFRIGPRINAVGRLEDATVGVKLLLCEDKKTARQLARELDAANESRKSLEDDITQEALAIIEEQDLAQNHRSLVVCREHWHSGVVGIVASRLVEKHYLPSIVLTRDKEGLKGSARSIRGLHLVKALQQCEGLLEKFGGHAYAAGLSLKKENLAEFTRRFDEVTRSSLSEENFSPALQLDAESEMALIDPQLLEQLHRLEPFGLGNPAPLLMLKGVTVRESRIVGERHLRLQVEESGRLLGAIGFRLAEKQPSVASQVDLAFIPEWNEWNGNKNIQLRIIDLRAAKK